MYETERVWDLERQGNRGREKIKCKKMLASKSRRVVDRTEVSVLKHPE